MAGYNNIHSLNIRFLIVIIAATFIWPSTLFSQLQDNYYFDELRGLEDTLGKTHLIYTKVSFYKDTISQSDKKYIHNFEPGNNTDKVIYGVENFETPLNSSFKRLNDFLFWKNDPDKYIICGTYGGFCVAPLLISNDKINTPVILDGLERIDRSRQNDSLIYVSSRHQLFKSKDRGKSWITYDSARVQLIAISPYNDHIIYGLDPITSYLMISKDGGMTFQIADTARGFNDDRIYFDTDSIHIYRKSGKRIFVYNHYNQTGKWESIYSCSDLVFVSNNTSHAGEIYFSDGRKIFVSYDFGKTFSLFKLLDKKVKGLYKKPNSDKLYATTKYTIHALTPESDSILITLPYPADLLSYYPMAVGNKWVYKIFEVGDMLRTTDMGYCLREIVKDTILSNAKKYFKIREYLSYTNSTRYCFERIDASDAKIYRFNSDYQHIPKDEFLIDDLAVELNDTAYCSRFLLMFSPSRRINTLFYSENSTYQWGNYFPARNYRTEIIDLAYQYSLWQGIGLAGVFNGYYGGSTTHSLKGCIINGKAFGDTTTVTSVERINNAPRKFSLNQNYPNPFNPTTVISYSVPVHSFVTLKVYDMLGKELYTLVKADQNAGEYQIKFDGSSLPSGLYFYRLESGKLHETRKFILLK